MKKFLFCLFVSVCTMQVFAKDLTPAQIQLRDEISTFLKQEGFVPEIDSEGDIAFKKEGKKYFIELEPRDENPMFITLEYVLSYPEDYTRDVVAKAAVELNMYKGIKVICFASAIYIQSDMYILSSEAFTSVFYKLLSQLDSVRTEFWDECEKAATAK